MTSNNCRPKAADIVNGGFHDVREKTFVPSRELKSYPGQPKKLFILEAKLGPHEWRAVCDVYPHADCSSCYDNQDEARRAKSSLKTLLLGPWKGRYRKKPIRIREISHNDQP